MLEGYAQVATYPPDVKHRGEFLQLQQEAQEEGRGLWAGETLRSRQEEGSVTETSAGTGQCDASYPTVCIPPPPPDLDCGDISYRRFKVLPPYPHRFDGDRDGIGCER